MGSSIKQLGDIIAGRIQKSAQANKGTYLELGIINADLSLKIDGMGGNISPGDYMVDIRLTHTDYNTSETEHEHSGGAHSGHELGTGTHTHDGGKHLHRVPSVFRKLQAGDRVLVAWVGNDPIIVAIVVAGTTITT